MIRGAVPSGLLQQACEPYRAAGRFAYHFARGKLRGDPAFLALLEHGWLADRRRIVDLGCGQGLLFAWLLAARRRYEQGDWPAHWPAPPRVERLVGIDQLEVDLRRARAATREAADYLKADLGEAELPAADAFVLLDVLHYLAPGAQQSLLARVRAALPERGVLLLRVGDADAGLRFRLGNWIDRTVMAGRAYPVQRLHCRGLPQWRSLLHACGFDSQAVPLSQGTPFANVLLVAHARGGGGSA